MALLAFNGTALASDAVTGADGSWLDLARPVFDALSGGHYAYAGALLIIVIAALVKRYLGDKVAWLHTDAGGSALALVTAAATATAAGLAAPGATLSLGLLKTSLAVGVGAAGGYAVLKNLIVDPILVPLETKAPAWAKLPLALITWVFDHGTSGQQAIAAATAAGTAAVAASPAPGAASVTGTPTDVK